MSDKRDVRLSTDEEAQSFSALDAAVNPWIKPFEIAALETAMRRGELLSFHWGDLPQTGHLPETKNGKGRTVLLSGRTLKSLEWSSSIN